MPNPVLTRAEVLSRTVEGPYRRLVLRAVDAAPRVRPGHFATLGCADSGRLLRRAFFIHRADPERGTIELVLAEHGDGTRELASVPVGAELDLMAPLGTPFPLPEGPVSALLVAEGWASVPMFALAEEIRRRGGQVGFILGAPTGELLFGVEQARELTQDVLLVTADGSTGLAGRVTDPLAQAIRAIDATVVHAGGPAATLAAVARTAGELGARCWTALGEPMPCGTGLCLSCALPVVGPDGVGRSVAACTEGPVLDGARVRWAELVPAEAVA